MACSFGLTTAYFLNQPWKTCGSKLKLKYFFIQNNLLQKTFFFEYAVNKTVFDKFDKTKISKYPKTLSEHLYCFLGDFLIIDNSEPQEHHIFKFQAKIIYFTSLQTTQSTIVNRLLKDDKSTERQWNDNICFNAWATQCKTVIWVKCISITTPRKRTDHLEYNS